MNKFVHALILAFFAFSCWFVWGMLTLISRMDAMNPLPAFTRLCLGFRPLIIALPILAAIYCLYVWFRKSPEQSPWMNFFAATVCTLFLVTMPTMIAGYLPLMVMIDRLAVK